MKPKKTIYSLIFKRPFDFILSLVALIIFLPILLVIAILVRIKLGSPILFVQERPGKDGKIFKLYKFRTMTNKTDVNGTLLPDDARLTRFGKFLRSTSLDELPSLLNILKGDLSVVGPRPLLVEYLPLYNTEQRKRHLVRPGLTGLAQINGRNAITWSQKFEYDLKYISKVTFLNDIRIIFITIIKVLRRAGINSDSSATMDIFKGNDV